MTFWFAENGLTPTTNKCCYFEDRAHLSNFHFFLLEKFWVKVILSQWSFLLSPSHQNWLPCNFLKKKIHFSKFYQSHRNDDTFPYLKKGCQWHTNCIYWCSFVIGRRSGRKVMCVWDSAPVYLPTDSSVRNVTGNDNMYTRIRWWVVNSILFLRTQVVVGYNLYR